MANAKSEKLFVSDSRLILPPRNTTNVFILKKTKFTPFICNIYTLLVENFSFLVPKSVYLFVARNRDK